MEDLRTFNLEITIMHNFNYSRRKKYEGLEKPMYKENSNKLIILLPIKYMYTYKIKTVLYIWKMQ